MRQHYYVCMRNIQGAIKSIKLHFKSKQASEVSPCRVSDGMEDRGLASLAFKFHALQDSHIKHW